MKQPTGTRNRPRGGRVTVVGAGPPFFIAAAESLELGGYEVTCLVLAGDVAARIVQTRPDLVCVEAPTASEDEMMRIGARWSAEQPELKAIPILVGTSDGTWTRAGGIRAPIAADEAPSEKLVFERLLDEARRIVGR